MSTSSTPDTELPAIRALLAPWRAEQQASRSRPLQVLALRFQVQPVRTPAKRDVLLNDWPREDGDGRWTHNAHPDRTVIQTRAGDILVTGRERWRVRAVKGWRSFPVLDERTTYRCQSVDDVIWDASQ